MLYSYSTSLQLTGLLLLLMEVVSLCVQQALSLLSIVDRYLVCMPTASSRELRYR
jgi:hypothetical protein